ncbi:MAG: DUF4230 domain-containing protein [Lachnospiraceae bacterium]|jgi:hypothetical protein
MSEDKRIYTHLSFKIGTIFILVIILLAVFAGFKAASFFYKNKQPEITAAYISERINNVSELTTAEMLYSGLVIYSEGDIPLITKKGFSMRYTANIRAGIDFSKVTVKVSKDKVTVHVPEAEIQSVDVDSDSIEFYDERYALFNWTDKEDVVDAISISEEDASAHADVSGLLKRADKQTNAILKNILAGSVGDRELVFN